MHMVLCELTAQCKAIKCPRLCLRFQIGELHTRTRSSHFSRPGVLDLSFGLLDLCMPPAQSACFTCVSNFLFGIVVGKIYFTLSQQIEYRNNTLAAVQSGYAVTLYLQPPQKNVCKQERI